MPATNPEPPKAGLPLTIVAKGELHDINDPETTAEIGVMTTDPVEYVGHVIAGMIHVRFRNQLWLAHPHCFKELR